MNNPKFQMASQNNIVNNYVQEKPKRISRTLLYIIAIIVILILLSSCFFFSSNTFIVPNFIDINNNIGDDLSINGSPNRVIVKNDDLGQVTLLTPQDIATSSSPTFKGLTLDDYSGNIQAENGKLIVKALDLSNTQSVENTLNISNGGTGVSNAPQENQILLGDSNGTYGLTFLKAGNNITINKSGDSLIINSTGGSGGGSTEAITFNSGSSGSDFNIIGSPVSPGGVITLNIPSATTSARGLVTTLAQTFGGNKTFNNDLNINGNTRVGDFYADTVIFNALVDSNFTPYLDNTYSLGTLGNRWQDLYLGPSSLNITSTTGTSGSGTNYTLMEQGFTGGAASFVTSNVGTNTSGNFGGILFKSGINTGQTTNPAIALTATNNLGINDYLFTLGSNNSANTYLRMNGNGKTFLTPLAYNNGGYGLNMTFLVDGNTVDSSGGGGAILTMNITNQINYTTRALRGVTNYNSGATSTGSIFGASFLTTINSGTVMDAEGGSINATNLANVTRYTRGSEFTATNGGTTTELDGIGAFSINNGTVSISGGNVSQTAIVAQATNNASSIALVGVQSIVKNTAAASVDTALSGFTTDIDNNGLVTGSLVGSGILIHSTANTGLVSGDLIGFHSVFEAGGEQTISGTEYGMFLDLAADNVVDNAYGIRISDVIDGDINNYGLYIGDVSGGSGVNYAIYAAGGDSFFADNVNIGGACSDLGGGDGGADGCDVAETFSSNQSLEAGDVVKLDLSNGATWKQISKTASSSENAIGIVSTNPTLVMGNKPFSGSNAYPVGLSGVLPTKVIDQNGLIKRGDYVTTSDTLGRGMKGSEGSSSIGIAMEDQKTPLDVINVLVSRYNGKVLNAQPTDLTMMGFSHDLSQLLTIHDSTLTLAGIFEADSIKTKKIEVNSERAGSVTVLSGSISTVVPVEDLKSTAKVFLTPVVELPHDLSYWIEVEDGQFKVNTSEPLVSMVKFNYLVID